jgi:hypothetical protein
MFTKSQPRTRWILILVLLTSVAASVICVAYPIYVIRPFRAQGARELAAALAVTRWRSMVTVISCVVAFAALVLYWRSAVPRWQRLAAAVGAGLVCVLAFLARVNVYEHMFHPIGQASFASALRTNLEKDEKVIAVKIGGVARAYPIRIMAYHHLINDVVNRIAIVATY